MIDQITIILNRIDWERVTILDDGEKMVSLKETSKLVLGNKSIKKGYNVLFYVRETVAKKLYNVSRFLPIGYQLVLIEGYRTLEMQKKSWDRTYKTLKKQNPHWSHKIIEAQTNLVVAKPNPLANHHCGGAVNVCLLYRGKIVDMGSPYPDKKYGMEIQKMYPMNCEGLTKQQQKNRKILRDAMEIEDFVWYPGEWWHYCWGDRMWAVYSHQTRCYYGPIELD